MLLFENISFFVFFYSVLDKIIPNSNIEKNSLKDLKEILKTNVNVEIKIPKFENMKKNELKNKNRYLYDIELFFENKINEYIDLYNTSNKEKEKEKEEYKKNIIELIKIYENPEFLLESKNGFSGKCWGPGLWKFLHMISLNFPVNPSDEIKKKYYDFIISLGYVLPCKICRDNYSENLKNVNFSINSLDSRKIFNTFIFNLHNEVNKKLGKPLMNEQNYLLEICRSTF